MEKLSVPVLEKPSNSKQPQNKRGRLHAFLNVIQKNRTFLYIVLIIAFIAMSKFLLDSTVQVGTTAAMNSYLSTFESEKESTYQTLFQYYYDEAKNKYLVSNRVGISVGDMKETANLEVLKVSDVEYIIEDQKDGITSWLEVPGEGTYIVNLQAAEFVIDNDNSYVLVRAPHGILRYRCAGYGMGAQVDQRILLKPLDHLRKFIHRRDFIQVFHCQLPCRMCLAIQIHPVSGILYRESFHKISRQNNHAVTCF